MQRSACTATAGNGEIFLALFDTFLFVCACDRMLETGRIRGIAGNGNIHARLVHDGNTLAHIVRTVATHFRTFSLGIRNLTHDCKRSGIIIELCLHIGETVDPGNNLRCILA